MDATCDVIFIFLGRVGSSKLGETIDSREHQDDRDAMMYLYHIYEGACGLEEIYRFVIPTTTLPEHFLALSTHSFPLSPHSLGLGAEQNICRFFEWRD
jgi:hypothetical protein